MKRRLLSTWTILFILFTSPNVYSNVAQPGVWGAGGTVFTMIFPEDSTAFKKVQMVDEQIYIQLYKGFAVVKGVYTLKNTVSDSLSFHLGYPINGVFEGGQNYRNQIYIDSLSHFKVKLNNQWVYPSLSAHQNHPNIITFRDNWKVWHVSFLPQETKLCTVYFMVNTNEGTVRQGYQKEQKNAFIYLLESGSIWKQPIEEGSFFIQLKDDILKSDLSGISSGFYFKWNQELLLLKGTKHHFSPTPKDNLVITYLTTLNNFDFSKELEQAEFYFDEIDKMTNLYNKKLILVDMAIQSPYVIQQKFGKKTRYIIIVTLFLLSTLLLRHLLKRKWNRK